MKRVLYITLNEYYPLEELLLTLLLEAEKTVNTLPISHESNDAGDMGALTPIPFLISSQNTKNLPGISKAGDLYGRKQWPIVQYMADKFLYRWIREYMPEFQKRSESFEKTKSFGIGDIDAIPDGSSRNNWKLGKITKEFPGRDGQIRSADHKINYFESIGLLRLEVGECWISFESYYVWITLYMEFCITLGLNFFSD
ncbi:hypothetical protein JTB14_033004 [Gonioctena quinquepunctata]|nr:hypothetical protein JTB14_033004 [Gonioctena quinquepunctata]